MKKKCPTCQSTKTHENRKYFTCDNCGFVNKKKKDDGSNQ